MALSPEAFSWPGSAIRCLPCGKYESLLFAVEAYGSRSQGPLFRGPPSIARRGSGGQRRNAINRNRGFDPGGEAPSVFAAPSPCGGSRKRRRCEACARAANPLPCCGPSPIRRTAAFPTWSSALSASMAARSWPPLLIGLLRRPGELPGLIRVGRDCRIALRSLRLAVRRLGPALGFEADHVLSQ